MREAKGIHVKRGRLSSGPAVSRQDESIGYSHTQGDSSVPVNLRTLLVVQIVISRPHGGGSFFEECPCLLLINLVESLVATGRARVAESDGPDTRRN